METDNTNKLTPEQEEYLRHHYWEKQQEDQELWEKEHSKESIKHKQWNEDYQEWLWKESQKDEEY